MLKVAVTGATSFIGKHLLSQLESENVAIKALTRKKNSETELPKTIINYCGDLLDITTMDEFIRNSDVVINLAYLWDGSYLDNMKAMENIASLCAKYNVKRLIHCSTSSVYGTVNNNAIDENTTCSPSTEYAKTKFALENYLFSNFSDVFEIIVLRPTQVFGPGGKNLIKLANDITKSSPVKNYLKSCLMAKKRMNLVAVDNVAAAIHYLIFKNELSNKVYLISDDEAEANCYETVESILVRELAKKGYRIPSVALPLFMYKYLYQIVGKGAINPKVSYLGKNLKMEGFIKPVGFQKELVKFAKWYNTTL